MRTEELKIWTDGSCTPSNGKGGVGVVFVIGDKIVHEISASYAYATNNKMEIMAIAIALGEVPKLFGKVSRIELFTDSKYCLGIIENNNQIHTNFSEWDAYKSAFSGVLPVCHKVHFHHTKGHDQDEFNNRADLLATIASGFRQAPKDFKLIRMGEDSPQKISKPMLIALDFDGTVVEHRYPEIGREIGAVPVLKALQDKGHQFILYTMRDNHSCGRNCLKEAADWFSRNNISLLGINCNPYQKTWTDSPKVYAPLYIDDAALGAPLKVVNQFTKPFIDWVAVVTWLQYTGYFTEEEAVKLQAEVNEATQV